MHRLQLRRLVAPVLGASMLMASAGVTAADEPATYVLDVWSCGVSDAQGNPVEPNAIPAGSELQLFEGWLAATRGDVIGFTKNVTWVLTVDGQPVDVTPDLTGPIPFGPFWANIFVVSAGTIGSGQTIETHYDNVLKSASFDGFVHWAKGSVYNGGVDCSVTGA